MRTNNSAAIDASTGAPATNTTNTTDRRQALADIECTDVLAGHAFALRKLYDEIVCYSKRDMPPDLDTAIKQKDPVTNYLAKMSRLRNKIDCKSMWRYYSRNLSHISHATKNLIDYAEKLYLIKRTESRITRHMIRLKTYSQKILDCILTDGMTDTIKSKSMRLKLLISRYGEILDHFNFEKETLDNLADEKLHELQIDCRRIFGERLRQSRRERKISMDEMAMMLGISRVGYGYYELGQREIPLTTICRLAVILDEPLDWLFGLEDRSF